MGVWEGGGDPVVWWYMRLLHETIPAPAPSLGSHWDVSLVTAPHHICTALGKPATSHWLRASIPVCGWTMLAHWHLNPLHHTCSLLSDLLPISSPNNTKLESKILQRQGLIEWIKLIIHTYEVWAPALKTGELSAELSRLEVHLSCLH